MELYRNDRNIAFVNRLPRASNIVVLSFHVFENSTTAGKSGG
jgi:hypothetical protein